MTHTHLDMNQIIQEELRAQRSAPGRITSNKPMSKHSSGCNIRISEEIGTLLNAEHGPQQVESLLRYVVDFPLEKAMDDALDDNDAVRHLLARRLKKKPGRSGSLPPGNSTLPGVTTKKG